MRRFFLIFGLSAVAVIGAACSNTNQTAADNANTANLNASNETASTTRPGPDNSEITTNVDAHGVKTETRVFRDNKRISKVVVTTHNGTRTVKAYSPSGEEKEVNKNEPEDVLEAAGSKVADAAGFVADKAEDVAGEAKDKTKAVGEKTVDTAKKVGEKTAEGAVAVKDKTVEGSKTVAHKTAEGAKKTGRAIKKVIP